MLKRSLLILGLLLFIAAPLKAQDAPALITDGKRLLEKGVNTGETASLKQAHSHFERATSDPAHAALAHYYTGLASYRLIPLAGEDEQVKYADDALDHLQKAVEQNEDFADAYALMGGVYGMKAGLQPWKAMFLGPKAGNRLERARKLAPDNPRVALIDGIGTLNTPSMFGGGAEEALPGLRKAVTLFERSGAPADSLQPAWGHADAYAWLGQAQMKLERYDEAKAAFEKALAINPEFGYVKYRLMPQLAEAQK